MTIARIDHFALWTDDVERLRDFYVHQLGAEPVPPCDAAGRSVMLDFCGVGLELFELDADPQEDDRRRPGRDQLAFALGSADAVDEHTARLGAAGYQVLRTPSRHAIGRYLSLVLDPDGNRVELTV
jgi:lactoylglutathione lyase